MSISSLNLAMGGVATVAIVAGTSLSINEYHEQTQSEYARSMLTQYAVTAKNMFLEDGTWPSSLAQIKAQMPSPPSASAFGEPTLSVRADGAIIFTLDAKSSGAANQIAKSVINESLSSSGSKVALTVTPPEGTNLRNIYKAQIDSGNKSAFSPNKAIDVNSHQITGIQDIALGSLLTNCVFLGSSSICDGANGQLQLVTSIAQISSNLQVSTSINASIVEVINGLKAKSLTANDLVSTRTTAGDIILSAANLTNADVDLLTSTSATMKSFLADKLTVSGNTTLAKMVATGGTLNKITGPDFKVDAKAVFKELESSQLIANDADLDVATIAQLITTIGSIDNLTANLIDINQMLSNVGVINQLQSTSANIQSATITTGGVKVLNSQTFKGKIADLGAAVISANLTVDAANLGSVVSDTANITTLKSTTFNSTTSSGKNLNVSNLLNAKNIAVTDVANVTGSFVVNGLTTTKALAVNDGATIGNLLTALRMVVNDDVIVAQLLRTKDLNVTTGSTFADVNVTTGLTTENATVIGAMSAPTMTVTNNVQTNTASLGALNANSMNLTGSITATTLNATTADVATLNASSVNATSKLTTNALIANYQSSINRAVVTNLTSASSALGAIDGVSLALSGNVQSSAATLNAVTVNGAATLASLEVGGASVIRGSLTSTSDITGLANLTTGAVTAASANINIVNSNTVTAVGNIVSGNAITASGANLNTVNNVYINHDSRILTLEQFRNECTNNWTYACAGTLPKLTDITCTGCVQSSGTSGLFSATSISKIIDCPAGCNYKWTVGAGLSKTTCADGSVTAGQSKTVNCLVSASPALGVDKSLASTVNLSVSHAQRATLLVNNDYTVNWSFVGATPVATLECNGCERKQTGSGEFTGKGLATVENCGNGCSYQWTLGPGLAVDVCQLSGSINLNSQSIDCQFKSSPAVPAGQTLPSTITIKVTSNSSPSKFSTQSANISWLHEKSLGLENYAEVKCGGSCFNCSSAPTTCSGSGQGFGTNGTATATVVATVLNACKAGETCTYEWSYTNDLGVTPTAKVNSNQYQYSLEISQRCRFGGSAESEGMWSVKVKNITLNQQASFSYRYRLYAKCQDSSDM